MSSLICCAFLMARSMSSYHVCVSVLSRPLRRINLLWNWICVVSVSLDYERGGMIVSYITNLMCSYYHRGIATVREAGVAHT